VVLGIAAIVVAVAVPVAWHEYNAHWPPRVDDRELARIGSPVPGAIPVGNPYTSGGSVLCVDQCLVRAQAYLASGQLRRLATEAAAHMARRGYRLSHPKPLLECEEYGPPVFRAGHYELDCYLDGHTPGFDLTETFRIPSMLPLVPMPPNAVGEYRLPVGTTPALDLTHRNGQLTVEVTGAAQH
jgi:hypothetical protein